MKPLLVFALVTLLKAVAAESENTHLNLTTIEKKQISDGVSSAIKQICAYLKDKESDAKCDPTLKECVLNSKTIVDDIRNLCNNVVVPLDTILGRDKDAKTAAVFSSLPDDRRSTDFTTDYTTAGSSSDAPDYDPSLVSSTISDVDISSTVPPGDDTSILSTTSDLDADASVVSTTTAPVHDKGKALATVADDKDKISTTVVPGDDILSTTTENDKSKIMTTAGDDEIKSTAIAPGDDIDSSSTTISPIHDKGKALAPVGHDKDKISTTVAHGDDTLSTTTDSTVSTISEQDTTTDHSVNDKYLGGTTPPKKAELYSLGTVLGSAFGALIIGIVLAFVGIMLYKRYRMRGESYTIPPEQGLQMQN